MTSSLRLGVLGAANIARGFVDAVRGSPRLQVAAVASRKLETAQRFAQEFGIGLALQGYDALLARADIDAVYIPLPNSLHFDWALRALQAGKHVLCEKPLVPTHAQAAQLFEIAQQRGCVLVEAFPFWFQPQTQRLLALLASAEVGTVRQVQSSFGFTIDKPDNIRFAPELGGGALLDAGCYAVSLALLAMGSAPAWVQSTAAWGATGVDLAVAATLGWADGRTAQIACSMQSAVNRHATINATLATVQTDYLNHTTDDAPGLLRVRRGAGWTSAFEPVGYALGNGFRFEAEAFAGLVRGEAPGLLDILTQRSLEQARTMQALQTSLATGDKVTVA